MKSLVRLKEQRAIVLYVLFAALMLLNVFCLFYEARSDTTKHTNHQSYGQNPDGAKLKRLVKRASMGDNKVIVTILDGKSGSNSSLFGIFLDGFKLGNGIKQLLNHIVVFTEDGSTYEYCKSLHPHCFNLATYRTISNWGRFKNHDHPWLGWRIVDLLGEILDVGYSVLFTEVDVLWMRNPFSHFKPTRDVTTALENVNSDVSDLGFFYLSSNEKTFQFLKYWKMSSVLYPNATHKSVFETIKDDNETNMIGLQIDYLDRHVFNGFCEPTLNTSSVCILHAKCHRSSAQKAHYLRQIVGIMKNSTVTRQAEMN